MSDMVVSSREIIQIGATLNEYDRIAARYTKLPPSDPGMRAMDDMERRMIGFLRAICNREAEGQAERSEGGSPSPEDIISENRL